MVINGAHFHIHDGGKEVAFGRTRDDQLELNVMGTEVTLTADRARYLAEFIKTCFGENKYTPALNEDRE